MSLALSTLSRLFSKTLATERHQSRKLQKENYDIIRLKHL